MRLASLGGIKHVLSSTWKRIWYVSWE